MKKRSKRYQSAFKAFDQKQTYTVEEAIKILKGFSPAKFDESVDLNMQLGIRFDQPNEMVRGTAALPFGTGKKVRVVCFVKGEAQKEAQASGADFVGAEELVQKISDGWMDFDAIVAHPDMMRAISKLGKVLGPRGLMPTPKTGTVTTDVARAVKEIKAGRVEFKSDKTGGLHVSFGKRSFDEKALLENAQVVIRAITDAKPAAAKGDFIKKACLSTSQGPAVKLRTTPMAVVLN